MTTQKKICASCQAVGVQPLRCCVFFHKSSSDSPGAASRRGGRFSSPEHFNGRGEPPQWSLCLLDNGWGKMWKYRKSQSGALFLSTLCRWWLPGPTMCANDPSDRRMPSASTNSPLFGETLPQKCKHRRRARPSTGQVPAGDSHLRGGRRDVHGWKSKQLHKLKAIFTPLGL